MCGPDPLALADIFFPLPRLLIEPIPVVAVKERRPSAVVGSGDVLLARSSAVDFAVLDPRRLAAPVEDVLLALRCTAFPPCLDAVTFLATTATVGFG
jgi:hypothetical protein